MIFKKPQREKPLALIIDDDFSLRISMQAALVKAGFDVREAENGRLGLQAYEEESPDLILLDVVMPEMDGFETCTRIRGLPGGEYVQILMVTGLDDTKSTEKAFEVGANGFISKPINWVMLGHRGKYMLRAGRAFQELNRSKYRLAKTQKLAKLGNWEIDQVTNEFTCSLEARNLLGIEGKNRVVTFDDFLAPISAEEKDMVQERINTALEARKSFSINYRVIHPDGTERHILNQGEILFNETQVPEIMLGAVQDVTQLKLAEEEIRYLAFYDSLTGLANRMLFLNRLDQEIAIAKRSDHKFALLFLDLDQFKLVNDTFGHHIGDQLLKKVSDVLQNCIRRTDIASRLSHASMETMIARLGGDEFTIILADIKEPEHAAVVARRIIKEIPKPYMLEGHEIAVTTSIGISLYPTDGVESSILLKNADAAMYKAKNSGRNNYQFYKKELNVASIERFSLERDLSRAIERGEFVLHFQPKISLPSREIVGAEALIRWLHPERGMVSPGLFIPIAEESGQIVSINKWVVESACSQWRELEKSGLDPGKIAVNLSGYQFTQDNVLKTVEKGLEVSGLTPEQLEVEITENILMQDTKETTGVLKQLKDMDIWIALDDFGTGYSSLSYLTTFQVDTIKIDRSFVMGCVENRLNLVVIKTIIAMGHSLNMKVVAEGVETDTQMEIISECGADEAQGFYFSRPLPIEEYRLLLEKSGSVPWLR